MAQYMVVGRSVRRTIAWLSGLACTALHYTQLICPAGISLRQRLCGVFCLVLDFASTRPLALSAAVASALAAS